MKVKLTKLKEADNPKHPNNIQEGHEVIGDFTKDPVVGEQFVIDLDEDYIWHTSIVQEIIDDKTFRTNNSIYKWEQIEG